MDVGKWVVVRYVVDMYVKVSQFYFQKCWVVFIQCYGIFYFVLIRDKIESKMFFNVSLIYQLFKFFCVLFFNFFVV